MAKKGKGKAKGKGKGKGKGKKGSAEPEIEPVDPVKEIKRMRELYYLCCRRYALEPLLSMEEQLKSYLKPNEDGDIVLNPTYVCSDVRVNALHTKAIVDTLVDFPHLKHVCFWTSAIGDQGAIALVSRRPLPCAYLCILTQPLNAWAERADQDQNMWDPGVETKDYWARTNQQRYSRCRCASFVECPQDQCIYHHIDIGPQ